VQSTITHNPNTSQSAQYLTTFHHNDAGQLTRAHVGDHHAQNVTFTNDENGQIIRRDESSPSNTTGAPHSRCGVTLRCLADRCPPDSDPGALHGTALAGVRWAIPAPPPR